MPSEKKDPREAIERNRAEAARRIADAMERDGLRWAADWKSCWAPVNGASGRPYRGVNRIALAAAMSQMGVADPRWMTFRQAIDAGYGIEKGTRSAACVEFWSRYVDTMDYGGRGVVTIERAREMVGKGRLPEEALGRSFLRGRLHHVFNATQLTGIEPYVPQMAATGDREVSRVADELIASSRCPVRECASDRAYYSPGTDEVTVPLRGQFTSMDAFARTLLHEMCHSTAPAVGRVPGAGEEGYAREELVAELGSVFAAADAGLDMGRFADADLGRTFEENHAAYLRGWASAIRDDPNALAKAAGDAARAADYVAERREEWSARNTPERERGLDDRSLVARPQAARESAVEVGLSGRNAPSAAYARD